MNHKTVIKWAHVAWDVWTSMSERKDRLMPSQNLKVDAILETEGLGSARLPPGEASYLKALKRGLEGSRIDPLIGDFAEDWMRVCPPARQYRPSAFGGKKELILTDLTRDPWIYFKTETYRRGEGLVEITSLVFDIQQGLVEPSLVEIGDQMRKAVVFYGGDPGTSDQSICHQLPRLSVPNTRGRTITVAEAFGRVTRTPNFRLGERCPVRIPVQVHPVDAASIQAQTAYA